MSPTLYWLQNDFPGDVASVRDVPFLTQHAPADHTGDVTDKVSDNAVL